MAQFGSTEFASRFKQAFSDSIRRTLDAYPEANVDITGEGLLLRHSDPAELRRAFVAIPGGRGDRLARRRAGRQGRRDACRSCRRRGRPDFHDRLRRRPG